jgi:hypothetical protein
MPRLVVRARALASASDSAVRQQVAHARVGRRTRRRRGNQVDVEEEDLCLGKVSPTHNDLSLTPVRVPLSLALACSRSALLRCARAPACALKGKGDCARSPKVLLTTKHLVEEPFVYVCLVFHLDRHVVSFIFPRVSQSL